MHITIKLDENKLKNEGCKRTNAFALLDEHFTSEGSIKVKSEDKNTLIYAGTGSKDDLSNLFICNRGLKTEEWFINSVIEWTFTYNGICGETVEDLIIGYRLKNTAVKK